ncbi:MAG TPA: MFS transporter, partial [Bradyrhizobium sp.]|nr:MFS transporter [Bradyrhizobium sp.]
MAGAFMTQLSTTMVNVSLLSLAAELHASLSTIQWVTSGYLLALAVMLPLTGWLVDRIGAKALYLWSFAAFTLSSTLCGLAWSANALIAFRVLQGMSGGLLAPMVQMMIARAAGKHMARIMGYAVVPILLAPILGPVIAGAILQFASWRWLFLVNLPVGAVAIVLAIFFLPNDREETQRRDLDLVGFNAWLRQLVQKHGRPKAKARKRERKMLGGKLIAFRGDLRRVLPVDLNQVEKPIRNDRGVALRRGDSTQTAAAHGSAT